MSLISPRVKLLRNRLVVMESSLIIDLHTINTFNVKTQFRLWKMGEEFKARSDKFLRTLRDGVGKAWIDHIRTRS